MVSLTGLGASCYSYGPSVLFALAPSVGSALFRSIFESKCTHLTTNKRQFAYFLLSSFIPTVLALRWQDLAWKTTLAVSAVLTLGAKYFSDKASPPSLKNKEQKLDVAKYTQSNSLVPITSNLLLAQAKTLPVETLLKSLIPGNYQVTIEGDVISISQKNIENEFKFWANKPLDQDLNQQDVDKLQGHIRYRDLNATQQKEIRKSIYQSLFLLVGKDPINLSFMTGYSGEAVTLKEEDSRLVISLGNPKDIEILINKKGGIFFKYYENKQHFFKCVNNKTKQIIYEHSPPEHLKHISPVPWRTNKDKDGHWELEALSVSERVCYFSMEEEDDQTIKTFNGAQYKNDALLIPRAINCYKSHNLKPYKNQETIVKYALNKSRSCLELLNFKLDEVVAFLKNGNEGQAKKAFQGCCDALSSFQKGLQLTENAASKALAIPDKPIEESIYSLGPMWSPVAASEDSFFTWHITTDTKNDKVSLRLEKGSAGRGMMGGKAQREVTVTKGKDPNLLTIEISKSNTNDLEHYDSSSKYSIENKGEAGIFVTPLGREVNKSCLPFILGMSFYQRNETNVQLPEQIQTDMDFIMKVLSTIKDIQSSPDTLILNESRKLICDLQGNPVPDERIKQLSNYLQEGVGSPLVFYDDKFTQGTSWNGVPVLNSSTAKRLT